MEHFLTAQSLILASSLDCDAEDGISSELLETLEQRLGVVFPPSFKAFLSDYGVLDVEGEEFYGEWVRDRIGGGLPSFVWATETSRTKGEIGPQDIRIRSSGYGPNFVIDCSEVNEAGEFPVWMVSIGYDEETERNVQVREQVADSYGAFFLQEIQSIISNM